MATVTRTIDVQVNVCDTCGRDTTGDQYPYREGLCFICYGRKRCSENGHYIRFNEREMPPIKGEGEVEAFCEVCDMTLHVHVKVLSETPSA